MKSKSSARVVAELRTHGAVAVLGAGVSYLSGYPLEEELHALVWHSLDADERALEAVGRELGAPKRAAKELVGDSREATTLAFQAIGSSAVARRAFQQGFRALDLRRRPYAGPAHDAVAQLLHSGVVERVISLNWDTATQFAHEHRYGRFPASGMGEFDKPHGDAEHPDSPWVLPNEAGGISASLKAQLEEIADVRPRVLLVVGYAERDAGIVKDLIAPLERRWRVVRIGPSVEGELDLKGSADDLLPDLAAALVASPELPGWEFVSFVNQRGIGAALSGSELGARDVEACPPLPEVAQVEALLGVADEAVLVGESGSGKSLAAYQSASAFHSEGWEVIRLSRDPRPETAIDSLDRIRHQTVAIVDDVQALPESVATQLLEMANPSRKVILVSADTTGGLRASLTIARGRAVSTIATDLRARRDLVLPLVQALDDRLGDGYLQESLERRIAEAAKSDTPWQFAFVLTGGERRAHQHMAELRDLQRFDIALAYLAAGQLLTLDRGVTRPWLDALAVSMGESRKWTDEALSALRKRRLLLEEETLRLPHLRYAAVALRELGDRHLDPRLRDFTNSLWTAVADEGVPLQGVSWLFSELRMSMAFRRPDEQFIDPDQVRSLLARCWNVGSSQRERSFACFVVASLLQLTRLAYASIQNNVRTLSSWLNECEASAAPGLASLLNSVANEDHDLAEAICREADAARLAGRVSGSGLDDIGAWGPLLGRLAAAAPRAWITDLGVALDVGRLTDTLRAVDFEHLNDLEEIVKGVWSVSLDATLELVEAALDSLIDSFNEDPPEATARTHEVIWFGLGYAPGFLRRTEPIERQVTLARSLATRLEPSEISEAISSGNLRTWHQLEPLLVMISEVAPNVLVRIADGIDLQTFSSSTEGMWGDLPAELLLMLHVTAESSESRRGEWLVAQHAGELRKLDPILARINLEATCEALERGCEMQLRRGADEGWSDAAATLDLVASVSHRSAGLILQSNLGAIRRGLFISEDETSEGLEEFLQAADAVDPGFIDSLLHEMEAEAKDKWGENVAGAEPRRRATEMLTERLRRNP